MTMMMIMMMMMMMVMVMMAVMLVIIMEYAAMVMVGMMNLRSPTAEIPGVPVQTRKVRSFTTPMPMVPFGIYI